MNFKQKLIFIIAFIVASAFCCSNAIAKPKAVISHGIYNLGEIQEGKTYDKTFSIDNVGDQDLKVKLNANCGCVKIISPKKEVTIKPGQKEKVEFTFDPRGFAGEVKKTIYIETNDTDAKTINLPVMAKIVVSPGSIIKRFLFFKPGMVIISGLADGINPCAFTVLVFFISFLSLVGYSRREMLFVGLSFILAVFVTYVLIGLGIFEFIKGLAVFEKISHILYISIALISLILGFLSIYDFFIFKKTKDTGRILLQLPGVVKQKIHDTIRQNINLRNKSIEQRKIINLIFSAFICGFFVSLFESVCTGQLYLPTIAYIFKTTTLKLKAIGFLLLYNLAFIVPLLLIFRLSFAGMTSVDFANIVKKHLSGTKLVMGVIFLLLGIVLIIIKN